MNEIPPRAPDQKPASPGRLAELLVKHGVVTPKQVEAARALDGGDQPNLARGLVQLGFVTDQAITSFLVKELKFPHLNLRDYQINHDTLKVIPEDVCRRFRVIPIDILGRNLTVAMVNPLDESALAAIQQACPEYRLKSFVCALNDFELVATRVFQQDSARQDNASEMSLASLGMAAKPAPKAPTKVPEPAPPSNASDDATKTMLFDAEMPHPAKSGTPLRSSLICLDGWELGREIELTGQEHALGRSPDADTTVNSPLISREHAKITRNEQYGQETFVITDLGSSNGTFVNNIPVTSTLLRHGDRIMLGNVLFKFVLLDEIEARFHKDVHHLYSIHKDTGLLPADAWTKELERALEKSSGGPLAGCLIEIDNLPAIAQTHGHIAGVIVMSDISDLLERYLEQSDLPGDFGDGRIAVTFEGASLENIFSKLEDLRCTIEAHVFHHKEDRFRTTVSIGLASAARGVATATYMDSLRAALHEAVEHGRNTVAIQHHGQ